MRTSLTFSRLAVGLLALAVFPAHTLTAAAPKNVILFIGDGMGFEHVKAARYYNGTALSFEGLPAQGRVQTYSANNAITDSAAAGTALATGRKVNNYVVSAALPGDGTDIPTSLEQSKLAGKKTGLITTTYLTHATPAAFGAHANDRNSYTEIGQDLLTGSKPNIMFGGGENGLTPSSTDAAGYEVATDSAGFSTLDINAEVTHISAQFGSSFLPYEADYLTSTYPNPHLSEMVAKALAEIGDDPTGFFLMVEGGMIDQAAHANHLQRTVHEVLEFSRAVQVALDWAAQRTDTLILVTADHETGGLTVTKDNGTGNYPSVTWSTTGHTGVNVPAYAIGVDAQRITGVLDNTDIYRICMGEIVPATGTVIAKGSTWRYNASGANLGTAWRGLSYDDSAWPAGPAELGYGDGDENTVIPSTTKYICYYFRHRFSISDPAAYSDLKLSLKRDDGAVVYLNGTEVLRVNMPTGTISYNTPASVAGDWGFDTAVSINNENNLLVAGDNVLAVEIHQASLSSSDISLDLELTAKILDNVPPAISGMSLSASDTSARVTWTTDEDADSHVFFYRVPTPPEEDPVTFESFDYALSRSHNILLSGLTASTDYQFFITSADRLGNKAITDPFTFTTRAGNTAPTAFHATMSLNEDEAAAITLTGEDPEGILLIYRIKTLPIRGILSGTPPFITYTPAPNFSGEDAFTFTVSDGSLESSEATVSIKVASINDPPVARADSATVIEGYSTTISVLANDTDPDGPSLNISAVTQPTAGSVVVNPDGTITFIASDGSAGTRTFNYTITDGTASSTATVTVTVKPNALFSDGFESGNFTAGGWTVSGNAVVDAAAKYSGAYGASLKRVASITKVMTGVPATSLKISYRRKTVALGAGEYGKAEYSFDNQSWNQIESLTGDVVWGLTTHDISSSGGNLYLRFTLSSDSVKNLFQIDDVLVAMPVINAAPVAVADQYSTDEDSVLTIDARGVLANDTDAEGQTLTASLVTPPGSGSLTLNANGSFTYTPVANWNGRTTFTYKANDGTSDSAPATVSITVDPVNDAPMAGADSYTMDQGTILIIAAPGVLANDSDVDGDNLTVTAVTTPANGTVTRAADGSFTYTPNSTYIGVDSFSYTVSDSKGGTATATVSITITAVNNPPSAQADPYPASEDTTLTVAAPGVLSNDNDPEGQTITAVLVGGPANGTLNLNPDGSFSYTPGANFNGTDSFTYKAKDASKESAPATVTITVTSVNDAPVAGDDSATTAYETAVTIDVLANDSDVDGGALSVTEVSTPSSGGAIVNLDGTVTYTPVDGFSGTATFDYTISDGLGGTATARVTVIVAQQANTMHVHSIVVGTVDGGKGNKRGRAEVTIVDASGNPVTQASVRGVFTEGFTGEQTIMTDAAGKAVFISSTAVASRLAKFTFTVNDVSKTDWTYNPQANVVISAKNY